MKTQDYSIDITSSLKEAISKEIKSMRKDVRLESFPRLDLIASDMNNLFQLGANSPAQILYQLEQSMTVFRAASLDYFKKDFNTLLDAYDRGMLFKNFRDTYNDHHYSETDMLFAHLIKSFESDKCNDELLKSPYLTKTPGHSRLDLIAKDYVSYLCQYGEISFNKSAVPSPEKPKKAKNIKSSGDAHSGFKPYMYCSKYRCVIHISETLYYKLFTYNYFAFGYDALRRINSHLVGGENLKGICICHCAISDADGLEKYINQKRNDFLHACGSGCSRYIIRYDVRSPNKP